ncbi:hypothetical protein GCM10027398_10150 [Azotobacter salinestris]
MCSRNGVSCKSQTYLAEHVGKHTTVGQGDLCQVVRTAGQRETLLELITPTRHGALKASSKEG